MKTLTTKTATPVAPERTLERQAREIAAIAESQRKYPPMGLLELNSDGVLVQMFPDAATPLM
jgi:hypothetical protein